MCQKVLRSKYDGAEVLVIKKVRRDVFDLSNILALNRAFADLRQNVVFYYKKRSKFGIGIAPFIMSVTGLERPTLEVYHTSISAQSDLQNIF